MSGRLASSCGAPGYARARLSGYGLGSFSTPLAANLQGDFADVPNSSFLFSFRKSLQRSVHNFRYLFGGLFLLCKLSFNLHDLSVPSIAFVMSRLFLGRDLLPSSIANRPY